MNISVVGSGYVGLVAGACFAAVENKVIMLDSDAKKIENLTNGIIPIYEPGLKELIDKNNNITFTTNKEMAYKNADVIFIAVGTPMSDDGSCDMQYVFNVAKDIAHHITSYSVIVNKSTMPVGSGKKVKSIIQENLKNKSVTFDIISNPEFLKEGVAINDFMSPDRVVIGYESKKALEIMQKIYAPFLIKNNRIIAMSIESAEMTKYASNALLATKISFINEISQICEKVGANINDVRVGVGADSRIGYSFIYPGCGYGGSCFPKDIKALRNIAKINQVESKILDSIEAVNETQKKILAQKIFKRFGNDLSGKTFCIWGLSFKPDTDDIREAPSLEIIKELLNANATIKAYDPKAMDNMKDIFSNIEYCKSKYDALKDADALVLITEWKEFRNPNMNKIIESIKEKIIFDGRNIYKDMDLSDFEYYYIGGGNTDI